MGTTAEQIRVDAGARTEVIGAMVNLSSAQIRRFEKAVHFPNDPDRMLAAYAAVGGLEDPREIYQRALDLWYEHGSKPLLNAIDGQLTGPQQFEKEIGSRRGRPRDGASPGESSSATPRRRASS